VRVTPDRLERSARHDRTNLANDRFNLGASRFAGTSCDNLPEESLAMTHRGNYASDMAYLDAFKTAATLAREPSVATRRRPQPSKVSTTWITTARRTPRPIIATTSAPHCSANGGTNDGPEAVVLVTDGAPNTCNTGDAVDDTAAKAKALADLGVPVFVLGFEGINEDAMQKIANAGDPAADDNPWYRVSDTASIVRRHRCHHDPGSELHAAALRHGQGHGRGWHPHRRPRDQTPEPRARPSPASASNGYSLGGQHHHVERRRLQRSQGGRGHRLDRRSRGPHGLRLCAHEQRDLRQRQGRRLRRPQGRGLRHHQCVRRRRAAR